MEYNYSDKDLWALAMELIVCLWYGKQKKQSPSKSLGRCEVHWHNSQKIVVEWMNEWKVLNCNTVGTKQMK